MAIIPVLVLLLVPMFVPLTRKNLHGASRYEMNCLTTAVEDYRTEYSRLPLDNMGTSDFTMDASGEIITILSAEDPHERNSRRISFYEAPRPREDGSGGHISPDGMTEVRDPWGRPYRIVLDQSGDGVITSPRDGSPIHVSVLVYSAGPDRNYDTWKDNLTSWD